MEKHKNSNMSRTNVRGVEKLNADAIITQMLKSFSVDGRAFYSRLVGIRN